VTRDLAESFGMKKPMGALVSRVLPDSPAEASGLRVGDVILEFNNREVVSSTDLPPIVGRTPVGEKVPVLVMREGKQTRLRVELGELPEDDVQVAASQTPKATKTSRLGISVSRPDRPAAQGDGTGAGRRTGGTGGAGCRRRGRYSPG
jgi:serine protease Do